MENYQNFNIEETSSFLPPSPLLSTDPMLWQELDTTPPPSPFATLSLLPPSPKNDNMKNINDKFGNDNPAVLDYLNTKTESITDDTLSSCSSSSLSTQAEEEKGQKAREFTNLRKFSIHEEHALILRKSVMSVKDFETSFVRSNDYLCSRFFKYYRRTKYDSNEETETKDIILTFLLWAILNDECLKNSTLIERLKNYLTQSKLGNLFENLQSLCQNDYRMIRNFCQVRKIVRKEMNLK